MNDFKTVLKQVFSKYDIELSDLQSVQFEKYYNMLVSWNEKVNLTSITEANDVIIKHFLDSCLCVNVFKEGSNLIDIGTGAGFPAVPVKILRPDLSICLVDSLQKRTKFLEELINELDLSGVEIIHSRSEQLGISTKYREKFDYCVSRAVAPLNILVEYCSPFVKVGGHVVCYKAKNLNDEMEISKNAFKQLNLKTDEILHYKIEEIESDRNILILSKTDKTPKQYPRRKNQPKIMPL